MKRQMFEIKVALLGHVSVGKTTVLNALLRDKFSEVSMRRTTAGINYFRISTPLKKDENSDEAFKQVEWTPDTEEPRYATSTHDEIKADNAVLRTSDSNTPQEKTFDIELDEPLFEMRSDTKLVLVDIPGINEAGGSQKYLDYVEKNWSTFDCVVVVMDVRQGVNAEEHIKLLKLVEEKNNANRRVPVIILCNKVDDPEDEEIKMLEDEVRSKVEQIFKAPNRKAALKRMLKAVDRDETKKRDLSPVFIPISAAKAFFYLMCHRLTLDDFKKQEMSFISKIGKEAVGSSAWSGLSKDEKYEHTYQVVQNASQYQKQLEMTKFDRFIKVLAYCIGGEDQQRDAIQDQLEFALQNLALGDGLVGQLKGIADRSKLLGIPTQSLGTTFFNQQAKLQHDGLKNFEDKLELSGLYESMEQLVQYVEGLNKVIMGDEASPEARESEKKAITAMEQLIRNQCRVVLEKAQAWEMNTSAVMVEKKGESADWYHYSGGTWRNRCTGAQHYTGSSSTKPPESIMNPNKSDTFNWNHVGDNTWEHETTKEVVQSAKNPGMEPISWQRLSPHDWSTIASSILLLSQDQHFVDHFGREKMKLEILQAESNQWLSIQAPQAKKARTEYASKYGKTSVATEQEELQDYLSGSYIDGTFVPTDATKYGLAIQIEMPESPSDPAHWGHLVWMYCQFMRRRAAANSA